MMIILEDTNQGTPLHGEPYSFPCFRNIGSPYISIFILPRFTIGLPVWFFSTWVVLNTPTASQASSPPQEHRNPIETFPLSPISYSSLSSSFPGESIDASKK